MFPMAQEGDGRNVHRRRGKRVLRTGAGMAVGCGVGIGAQSATSAAKVETEGIVQ